MTLIAAKRPLYALLRSQKFRLSPEHASCAAEVHNTTSDDMMLNTAKRVRRKVATLFHHFGIHCAAHQKRVILISSVVITSLFYPALALYLSPNPLSDLSSRFFNAFEFDVREIWEGHDVLRIRDDAAARARCGMEKTLRVERVLIPNFEWAPTGAATSSTVQFALRLDGRIRAFMDSALSCVRAHDNQCLVLSPSLFFDNGVPSAAADVLGAINTTPNVTVAGIPVSPSMLLSARSSMDGNHRIFEHVGFLALTYFFHDNDCLTHGGHQQWISTLAKVTPDEQGSTSVTPFVFQQPRFIALQYDPTSSRRSHFSAITLFLYLSYLIIFISFSGSLRRMDTVHSRFGLMFTGLIEIIASTITSVSVCALAGFRVTMVPWGILPVIIVFVGAENMFLLVDAVTSTSVTLPVKERVGTGLAVAGTSNTLKTVTYNTILGTIAFFSSGAIQQFCSFAIVLLVAHWFLIHTFFIAVLSIDLQRLELSDMLSQDKASKPSVIERKPVSEPPLSKRRRTMSTIQQLLRGRAAKNGSLVMMLAVTATLYYVTYPFPSRPKDDVDPFQFLRHATAMQRPVNLPENTLAPAWEIWNTLNPEHDHLVHIRIETPVVVALNTNQSANRSRTTQQHNYDPMARSPRKALSLIKIVILPIGTTTACVYLLLLYLLKDAELLEAQRNRVDGSSGSMTCPVQPVEDGVEFTTLPRTSATDVEFISANGDGSIIAIVSSENELFIWKGSFNEVNVSDILPQDLNSSEARPSITSVVIDRIGYYCAIGTDVGVVAFWRLTPSATALDGRAFQIATMSPVADMEFTVVVPSKVSGSQNQSTQPNGDVQMENIVLIAVCDNGLAVASRLRGDREPQMVLPSRPDNVLGSRILRMSNHEKTTIAFMYADGTLELCSPSDGMECWASNCILQAGNPTDPVIELYQQLIDVDGSLTHILATSTRAGVVSLWNVNQRECIWISGDAFGDVAQLTIIAIPSRPCQKCGEHTPDRLSLTFSVGYTIFVHRARLPSVSKRCTCTVVTMPFPRDVFGHRSRSGSISSATTSVNRPRLKISNGSASTFGIGHFPVSGHGAHTRRVGSDKDMGRRPSDAFAFNISHQGEPDLASTLESSSRNLQNVPSPAAGSKWRGFVVHEVASINCERGHWELMSGGKQLIGLRRRSRVARQESLSGAPTSSASTTSTTRDGLTTSVLGRWELWTFDPEKPETGVRTSTFLDLSTSNHTVTERNLYPRLPFTRISPLVVRSTICVAGLGNTVGVINFSHHSRRS